MTNDEAITIIKKEFSEYRDTLSVYAKKRKKAFDMAIKALEQQPCEDAVSRTDVLDLMLMKMGGKELYVAVYELPPVTPQPKRGKWIPVSERLPKENEYIGNVCKYYLIQDEYGDMHVAHLSNVGWIPMNSLKTIGDEIIAWRELPLPYKEDEE